MQRIKTLIVNGNSELLWVIFEMLECEADLQVTGLALTAASGRCLARTVTPDVALVDLHLPKGHGFLLLRQLRALFPEVRLLGMSMSQDEIYAGAAQMAGADGVLSKEDLATQLLPAIRCKDAILTHKGIPTHDLVFQS